ncbi:MAG: hypothetical protein ABWY56_06220 [Propionibacteriaceae bacterium]
MPEWSSGAPALPSSTPAVNPSWTPPSGPPVEPPPDTDPAPSRRSWLISAVVVLAVVAVIVVVWALGGFERRTDLLQVTAPGTLISTGPYEFTFTEVTAQRKKGFDDKVSWQLTAVGTGRTTGDISIAPSYGDTGTFVSKDTRSGETAVPTGVRYGEGESFTDGSQFTPGMPPIPIRVDFKYQQTYVPDRELRFVVFELEFTDNSLFGGQDKTWNKTNHGFDYHLPVRVLPEATT